MVQYISKDALVAEIKRRKELVSDPILLGNDLMIGERNAYFNLLSFIDTLEVKEVDLEKEIKEDWLFADKTEVDCLESMCLTEDVFVSLVKKYFQIGLNAQKGE